MSFFLHSKFGAAQNRNLFKLCQVIRFYLGIQMTLREMNAQEKDPLAPGYAARAGWSWWRLGGWRD